jgi:hypothetical protein
MKENGSQHNQNNIDMRIPRVRAPQPTDIQYNAIFEDETRTNAEIVELFPVPGSPSSMFNG